MNTPVISYRNATVEDLDSIISLIHDNGGDDRSIDHDQFVLACCNNKIVGCIRTVQAESDCKELASLAVLPEYRKMGIGSALVVKILKKDTSRPLYLICYQDRISFYNKHNFHQVDIQSIPITLQRDFMRLSKQKGLSIVVMILK